MVGHFCYLTGKHKQGTRTLTGSQMLRWEKRFPLHFILCPIYSNTKSFSLSWLLFKPCTYSSSSHLSSVILPFSYHCFSSHLSRSLFLYHRPYCPPHSFNACFVHPFLPLHFSLSLHFSRTQLDMWMNTWNSPWGVERSVRMLMTLLCSTQTHYTAQQ